ncbi:MAG: hypothetical protein IT565_00985, partial [Rhodospirillales bacterium]|nr:hypothetical protein [Rhodospirillales bacterium]
MTGETDHAEAAEASAEAARDYGRGDFARAARGFARALDLDPARTIDRANRAMALLAMNQGEEAESFL